jgi:hypothetical protein
MRTHKEKMIKVWIMLVFSLMAILASMSAGAREDIYNESEARVIYQNSFGHHGIYSYPSSVKSEAARQPEIVYVSLAYGPAIYSYAHPGTEKNVSWNVEYVDPAYGPAIYSYERAQKNGEVRVLPALFTLFK